ncbi:Lrp/AsnC family transcriptional regulator [Paenibacillus sp. YN15]|uniref:Lrp/AsnC family transcriptional regulator n=1 Tax=Paenibacillus sp. YN15 TaxID=1742774 RepID=UPI000DCE6876|nr:Lrp/AsnC family transcriptional regulator [Paenibacillus sp. YN15]RAV05088.1 Lrp/AsnC family transcriptional regulator [Paenibacillus sp. YN15]
MTLTTRRMQFLQKLVDLYHKTSLPIHYETLGQALGVSKWTAYDMLKEIEKLGFVSRSYEGNPNETGRSQVVFTPTAKASGLLKQSRTDTADSGAWNETVAGIKALLKSLKYTGVNDLIKKVLKEIPEKTTNVEFCGYVLGLLMIYLKKLGGKTETLIRHISGKAPDKEMGLTMFVGTVLGTIIHSVNEELGLEAADLVAEFLRIMKELPVKEQAMLYELMGEAL